MDLHSQERKRAQWSFARTFQESYSSVMLKVSAIADSMAMFDHMLQGLLAVSDDISRVVTQAAKLLGATSQVA